MRALFSSAPLSSHLGWGGYSATALELVNRNHDVLWVSGEEVADPVSRLGLPFRAVRETGWRARMPAPLPQDASQDERRRRALDQWLDPDRVRAAVDELDAVVREFDPDLLVGEMFMAATALAAERYARPFVVAGWPAPKDRAPKSQDSLLQHARGRLDTLLSHTRVSGVNWTQQGPPALCSPHLHLTYWSRSWFAGPGSTEDSIEGRDAPYGAQTRHVGGCAPVARPPDPSLPDPLDRPWVLITLGATFNEDVAFFRMAAQAAVDLGCLPIIAAGAALETPWVKTVQAHAPAGTEIRAWLDFEAVLPYTAAAIHHGGAGTTHALVTHAIPQIVVPHAADQMRQAQSVARTRVGVGILPRHTSVASLTRTLAELLPDRSPARAYARALQAEFAALGGPPVAAEQLEKVVIEQGKP